MPPLNGQYEFFDIGLDWAFDHDSHTWNYLTIDVATTAYFLYLSIAFQHQMLEFIFTPQAKYSFLSFFLLLPNIIN